MKSGNLAKFVNEFILFVLWFEAIRRDTDQKVWFENVFQGVCQLRLLAQTILDFVASNDYTYFMLLANKGHSSAGKFRSI